MRNTSKIEVPAMACHARIQISSLHRKAAADEADKAVSGKD